MWSCGSRAAWGAAACAVAVALGGCGGSGHAVAKKLTIAQACRRHGTAASTIVSGLVDYKTYMTAADPAFRLTFKHSGIAKRVEPAIATIESAVKPAARRGAGGRFFATLYELEGWLRDPAAVPSAVVGGRNTLRVEKAAQAVGCPLQSSS